jgi:radical SAM protein with 4Fe4S-binding SPASM domain
MINVTKLLYNCSFSGDEIRYERNLTPASHRPIVVWTVTRQCNLHCIHCYSNSSDKYYPGEISAKEAEKIIFNLAKFKIPVLLFSGGEPLLRGDLFQINAFAKGMNLRTVLSTNGTLITSQMAKRIKEQGFDYVGVSFDGIGSNNDRFRGSAGAFNLALTGIRNLIRVKQKTGLRFTITKHNYLDIPEIFKLAEQENIERICFYHLVYSGRSKILPNRLSEAEEGVPGRGSRINKDNLSHSETRQCLDDIYAWVRQLHQKGMLKEVLTVDNHADGPYIYLKLLQDDPVRTYEALRLLVKNGGNSSGIGIANIDNLGFVHPDQFWQNHSFGNVLKRDFGDIWLDTTNVLIRQLKDRKSYLKGRCAKCGFLNICNGNFRARAEAVYGDMWQQDPACYLTDEEVCNAIPDLQIEKTKTK